MNDVMPKAAGEGTVLPLPADPHIGGPGVLAAIEQIHTGGAAGNVLCDVSDRPCYQTRVTGAVAAILAQGAVDPAPVP